MTVLLNSDHSIMIAGRLVPVKIKLNARAKRLILRVDPTAPAILLTCSSKRLIKEGLSFARQREMWIAAQLSSAPAAHPFLPGTQIPIAGVEHEISHDAARTRSVLWDQNNRQLVVGGDLPHVPRRVEDWLRQYARKEYSRLADEFCPLLNVKRGRISVRDTRSRWGSCSSTGNLSLSWRLILSPLFVYRYVVAHEVSHLRHMDHSAQFWSTVDSLIDDRQLAQQWLKRNGAGLYGFGSSAV